MKPYVSDPDFTLYVGDVRQVLAELPAESVDCCVTSPPYWGLRDYGTDGQIGLEPTPEQFVAEMVNVFRQVRRVLAPHGTLWLNLGDSYSHGGNGSRDAEKWPKQSRNDHRVEHRNTAGGKPKDLVGIPWRVAFALQADGWYLRADIIWSKPNPMPESVTDRPTKAHEYVFLLSKQPRYFFDQEAVREAAEWARWGDQTNAKHEGSGSAAGWIGAKPKSELRKRATPPTQEAYEGQREREGSRWSQSPGATGFGSAPNGRNIRSVWDIATQPYPDAHFATFPEALPERCIKAGCPVRVCVTCGKPGAPDTVRSPLGSGPSVDPTRLTGRKGMNRERRPDEGVREITRAEQRDYAEQLRQSPHRSAMEAEAGPAFAHYVRTDESGARPIPAALLAAWLEREWLTAAASSDCGHDNWRTGVVLDPFLGSGTTALVARRLGRKCVGIELNEEYARLAARRLQQLSLLADESAA